jgi:hypothetical protein
VKSCVVTPLSVTSERVRHPGAEAALTELPSARQIEALRDHSIDLGFAHAVPPALEAAASGGAMQSLLAHAGLLLATGSLAAIDQLSILATRSRA